MKTYPVIMCHHLWLEDQVDSSRDDISKNQLVWFEPKDSIVVLI